MSNGMIDLYTWVTPNGRKVSILLEELGLPYEVHPIDIGKDDQFTPEFLAISPNNKIPAIVDRDTGISLMESGAILIYLADKTGKFLPAAGEPRYRVDRMADVADGRHRTDARPGAPLPALQQGQGALRRGALSRRGAPALRRARPAARGATPSSPATTRSPTSRSGRGLAASNGRRSTSTRFPTSSAGTSRSPPARPCRRAITCRNSQPTSRCRERNSSRRTSRVRRAALSLRSQPGFGSMRSATSTAASTCSRRWRRTSGATLKRVRPERRRSRSFSATMSTAGRNRARSSTG